jgi:outer membrane lipoprotein-sorting protein
VSKKDFLTKKIETLIPTDRGEFKYESYTDKYSLTDGVMLARETTVITGKVTQTSKLTEFKLNPAVPDSAFSLPVPWYVKVGESPGAAAPGSDSAQDSAPAGKK